MQYRFTCSKKDAHTKKKRRECNLYSARHYFSLSEFVRWRRPHTLAAGRGRIHERWRRRHTLAASARVRAPAEAAYISAFRPHTLAAEGRIR